MKRQSVSTRAGVSIFAVAFLSLLSVTADLARGDDAKVFAGKFSDNVLTVELSESGGGLVGTVTLTNQKFPAKASVGKQDALVGTFTASGDEYPFTATLVNNQMTLISGGKTYTLTRSSGNPLAETAAAPAQPNPLAQQTAAPAAADPSAGTATLLGPFTLLGSTSTERPCSSSCPRA